MKLSKKLSKEQTLDQIKTIFSQNPSTKQIKKAQLLARSKNIKLTNYKSKFCKNCLTYFNSTNSQTRIKSPLKIIKCNTCNHISRYKLKSTN